MRVGLATALKAACVDDSVIQMICRWTNPESLRAYARHGQSLHINCVDEAEHAIIDTIQSANVPKVCNTEGNAALHLTFAPTISTRVQAVLDAADVGVPGAAPAALTPASPVPDSTPLTPLNCCGRHVLVPAHVWPSYPCDEHDGRGWEAIVLRNTQRAATVRFLHATTSRGMPYEDAQLQLSALHPL
jgi:hypothetical protein